MAQNITRKRSRHQSTALPQRRLLPKKQFQMDRSVTESDAIGAPLRMSPFANLRIGCHFARARLLSRAMLCCSTVDSRRSEIPASPWTPSRASQCKPKMIETRSANRHRSARSRSTRRRPDQNYFRPFSAARRARSSGSEMMKAVAASLLRSYASGSLTSALLQSFSLLRDYLPRNPVVLDLRISVCEAAALLFLIARRHPDCARHLDQD